MTQNIKAVDKSANFKFSMTCIKKFSETRDFWSIKKQDVFTALVIYYSIVSKIKLMVL